jgi:hypothetical protein
MTDKATETQTETQTEREASVETDSVDVESAELESAEDRAPERDTTADLHLRDGRYHCTKILGEGSMGRTYLAWDAELEKEVAVKALYPSRLAEVKDLQLFRREAEVLQKLDHDQIPSYVDAFDEGEGESACYYLVQEYVEGDTLRAVYSGATRWDEAKVVQLGKQLLQVLVYMQGREQPVVHRDIKPENIIVRAADGLPCLVDFGAVREVVRLTMRGGSTIIGTYGYMPPEQLMGRALPATDLYAVGITMLEALTRQTPRDLHGEDAKRMIAEVNTSEELRRILSRLCAPELADRYESAEQVLADLEGMTTGALVHAKRLEKDIEKRRKAREKALKKAGEHGANLVYVFVVMILLGTAVSALAFLINAMSASFELGFLVAALIAAAGLMGSVVMLGIRYTHDSWEPPTNRYRKTTGKVEGFRQLFYDQNGNAVTQLEYSIDIGTRRAEFLMSVPTGLNRNRVVGKTFTAWYDPKQPNVHEMEDFLREDVGEMRRLFDENVEHTPE